MKKNTVILAVIFAIALLPAAAFCGVLKGSQYDMAKKYADKDEAPVIFFDPDTGDAKGYVLYADLNNDGENEMVIPYRIHKNETIGEDKADIYRQTLSVDVVVGEKKFRGFLEIDLTYVYTPKVYLADKQISGSELPKVFLMVFDGVKKNDKKCTLMYNSYDKKDKHREQKIFETDKMPWDLILFQFDRTEPTITEFDINYKESYGKFFIRPLDGPDRTIRSKDKDVTKFMDMLKKDRNDIFWEAGDN